MLPNARSPRGLGPIGTLTAFFLIAWLYFWLGTVGKYTSDFPTGYYELLAEGFLAGKLHLLDPPAPELLALSDPYDPAQRAGIPTLHDALLYDGKYYLYQGPAPAILHATGRLLTGRMVPTGLMCILLGLGSCLWFWLLARELRDRAFPRVPESLVMLVFLSFGLGGVVLSLLARSAIWEAPILAAGFFVLGGYYFWLRGLAEPRHAGFRLVLASLLLGCAFASRMTAIGYAVGPGLVMLWWWLRSEKRWSNTSRLLAYGIPATTVLALLLLYNQARFGSPLEFGVRYSVGGGDMRVFEGAAFSTFDLAVVPLNLGAYFLSLPTFAGFYPFLSDTRQLYMLVPHFPFLAPIPPGANLMRGYVWQMSSPMIPATLLAPLGLLAPLACGLVSPLWRRSNPAVRQWIVGAGIGLAFVFGTSLTTVGAVARYQHDFLPLSILLGGLVAWWLYTCGPSNRVWQALSWLIGGALLALTVVASLSLALLTFHLTRLPHLSTGAMMYAWHEPEVRLLQLVAPGDWSRIYFERTYHRFGIFYPEGSTLPVATPSGAIVAMEIESYLPAPTTVDVIINGHRLGQHLVQPGIQTFPLPAVRSAGPPTLSGVEFDFADSSLRPVSGLWPIRVALRVDQSIPPLLGGPSDYRRTNRYGRVW